MKTITLELSKLEMKKKRERWRLYFIIVTEHPTENDKMILSTFPDPYIRLKPNQDNVICFEPEGSPGADGMFIIEREYPADGRIKTHLYLRQSRANTRDLGNALSDLKTTLGGDAFEIITDLLGSTVPWLVVAKKALPMIGKVLSGLKDRDMGFVSMDESFDDEFQQTNTAIRSNQFSTGEAKLFWKWKVKNV